LSLALPLERTRRVRWWTVTVPALLYVLSYFHRIAPVVVAGDLMCAFAAFFGLWGVPDMVQVHGLSRVHASNLVVLETAGPLLSTPFVGWLSDRILQARKPPLVSATSLYAAG
jgi:MFS family permease